LYVDGGTLDINSTLHPFWEASFAGFPLQENYAEILAIEELFTRGRAFVLTVLV
jgi:hypothetical protein